MIERVGKTEFARMVSKYHYSIVLPKLSKIYLADRELGAVVSLGWGVRPLHTIKKLFPSLGTADYYEIGKLCVAETSPHGTESLFLSRMIDWVKKNKSNIKLIFTWADGVMGKVGYIYQASNFLYGGFIWTDTYLTMHGEKVHPRQTGKIGGRPSWDEMSRLGWIHYRGKQFRYCYFTCSHREKKRLLRETTEMWGTNYPKAQDLKWKRLHEHIWVDSNAPTFCRTSVEFSENARSMLALARQEVLFGDIDADEVSREKRTESIGEGAGRFRESAQL